MRQRVVFLALIFLLTLVGCHSIADVGGGANNYQGLSSSNNVNACPARPALQAVAPESGKVTLTVAGWASSPAEDALVQQNIQNFMQLHPNITLKWTPLSGDYQTALNAYTVNGSFPDVFYMRPDLAPDYISKGQLLNLSPYMMRDNVQPSDYYSALLAPFSCKDGQVYGLPKDWNTLGVFYNKALFDEAGVPYPDANWTWSDLRTIAKKLTKQTGNPATSVYGISLPNNSSRWLAFLLANGGAVLDATGKSALFNNQAGIDALNYYASFQQQDHSSTLPSSIVPSNSTDVYDTFGSGRAAMVIEGGWLIPYLTQAFPTMKNEYGIAPLPIAPTGKRANLIFTNAWSAYAGTKHADAAWELIQYMTGQAVERGVLQAGFALPSLQNLANDPSFAQNPGIKVLFDAAAYGYPDAYGAQDSFIHNRLNLAIGNVLTGKVSAKAALDSAAQQIDRQLQSSPPP